MTDAEWSSCTDPKTMLGFLKGKVSDRKLRLFACACCRRVWHFIPDDAGRQAIEVSEQYADQRATAQERKTARGEVMRPETPRANGSAKQAVSWAAARNAYEAALYGSYHAAGAPTYAVAPTTPLEIGWSRSQAIRNAERSEQSQLLRDIFGNPFRPIAINSTWLRWNHGTVPALARHIYEDRAFAELSILADALEDAGCTDADILDHCRQASEHVRGCWVVDLTLGKS